MEEKRKHNIILIQSTSKKTHTISMIKGDRHEIKIITVHSPTILLCQYIASIHICLPSD